MTDIEWVLNQDGTRGITVNSKTGCLNGCEYCYARKLANGRLKTRYLENPIIIGNDQWKCAHTPTELNVRLNDPFYPRWWPERLEQLRKRKKPTGIFLDDMSDWMGDYWPEEWTRQELQVMRDCPQHRLYTLTKQPQNLIKFSPFPDNCWVGVTVCNDKMLDVAVDKLEDIQAKIKFISFEPLLERLTLSLDYAFYYSGINWLIIGALTGTKQDLLKLKSCRPELTLMPYGNEWTLQPRIEWVQEIVEAADKAGIPVFLKENLRHLLLDRQSKLIRKPFCHSEFKWHLRQEMPRLGQSKSA